MSYRIYFQMKRQREAEERQREREFEKEMERMAREEARQRTAEEREFEKKMEGAQYPPCSECGSYMVKRMATKGFNKGKYFLGCSRYPECKNIVNCSN